MRHGTLLLLALSVLVFVGCKNNKEQPAARSEEPYTPGYASLDSMDSAPAADTTYEPPPPAATAHDAAAQPAVSEADEPLAPVGGQVYTVQKGDTLYKLARRFYNDQGRWRDIWEANKNRLADPNKLQVGMKLIIP
jgi:nucleoid-associated protein YgaU